MKSRETGLQTELRGSPIEQKLQNPSIDTITLSRTWWRNWWLMAGASLVTVIGLTVAMLPMIPERFQQIWPWAATDKLLLAGVCVVLACLIGYLTFQQNGARRHIEKLLVENQLQAIRHYKRLVALLEVSHMVGYQTDLQSVFDGITSSCNDTFKAQWASLMLYEPESMRLVVASCSGAVTGNIIGSSRQLGEGVAGWVAKNRKPILLNETNDESMYPGLKLNYTFVGCSMVVPLMVDGDLVGIISVAGRDGAVAFTEDDLHTLMVFSESVGVSIRHAKELSWLRQVAESSSEEPAPS